MTQAVAIPEAAGLKRAVVYLRVSTLKQAQTDEADGYSLPAQREACYRKAEALGAEVVEVYVDRGESAKTADRVQFQRMLARIREQQDIDYVILDKVDRFARNRRDDANILFELKRSGAQLVSVKENIDDTAPGQLLHAIMAGIAEFYSTNLAGEALKGMTQKAAQGGTPGRAPIGYLNTRRRTDDGREIRTVVVDPDRASHVQWAFEAYSSGEWTIRTITEALDEKGLRALPHGRKVPGPVQPSHVHALLSNRYYVGKVTFNGVEYEGKHQPLVPDSLFDRVQEVLAAHGRAGEKQRVHHHYLKGTVYCAGCGSRLCITNAKGRYMYYYCLGRQLRRTECTQKYMAVEAVEMAVERHYIGMRMPKTEVGRVQADLRAQLDHQHQRAEPEIAWARKRAVELEAERRRLARGVISGAIPDDLGREEQDRITTELKQANAVLHTAETIYAHIEQPLRVALELAARIDEVYRIGRPPVRRLANQFFFEKLLLTQVDGQVQVVREVLREPWATILAENSPPTGGEDEENPDQDHFGRGSRMMSLVPPAGFEPALSPPEGDALSPELRGLGSNETTSRTPARRATATTRRVASR
jgi:site-specific DNA recombinase